MFSREFGIRYARPIPVFTYNVLQYYNNILKIINFVNFYINNIFGQLKNFYQKRKSNIYNIIFTLKYYYHR